uniref:Small auxin up regulated protein n=1 Tax=Kalanchoe fedtschenkoi TaxID=63787 RepID=A0A7N0TU26_KALFE
MKLASPANKSPSSSHQSFLGKTMKSFKKLSSKKTRDAGWAAGDRSKESSYRYLLIDRCKGNEEADEDQQQGGGGGSTPTGYFAVYVGEERRRFVVRTSFLSHPLFKMLLEKASQEFGFQQSNGLVVPCSVSAFQEVINSVECCSGKFEFGDLVDEFL